MSTDTTPDAAGHAAAIRAALTWLREAIADTDNASELVKTSRLIRDHVAALDAARIAAEERAERLLALVNICKQEAQRRELGRAYLRIDWQGAHEAAGIQPGDLDARQNRDTTEPFDWEKYRNGLEGEPEWESAEDLGRLSMESHITDLDPAAARDRDADAGEVEV